jgi:hypothetical protein
MVVTMVQIQPGLFIHSATAAQRAPASAARRILSSFLKQSAPGVPVAGVLAAQAGYTPLDVLPHASLMQYTVKAGYAVTLRSGEGGYIVGTQSDVTVPTIAAHATLPRYDVLYIVQPDYEKSETGEARIDVVNGTAASTPTVPSLPAGALELGRKLVPAGATNTTTGTAISNKPAKTGVNVESITVSQISDPQNLDAAKIGGRKITVNNTGTAPSSPAVGDVWVDYS